MIVPHEWLGLGQYTMGERGFALHMNYGELTGIRRKHLVEQAEAENLQVVNNLIVNRSRDFPMPRIQEGR